MVKIKVLGSLTKWTYKVKIGESNTEMTTIRLKGNHRNIIDTKDFLQQLNDRQYIIIND